MRYLALIALLLFSGCAQGLYQGFARQEERKAHQNPLNASQNVPYHQYKHEVLEKE